MSLRELARDVSLLDHKRVVGVGDLCVSDNPDESLVTFSLGSCVAIAVYDPVARVGGLLHAMLPDAAIAVGSADFNPCKYVNSGLPLLFKACYGLGAQKNRIRVRLAGCSSVLDNSHYFNIGKRNYAETRKNLWKNNVLIDAECCDANESITLVLKIGSGDVILKIKGNYYLLGK
jgi:chemotaxis protein CheD